MGDFAVYEEFSPRDYLESYYGELKSEGGGLLRFLVEQFRQIPDGVRVLEFGGGPTLVGAIPAARRASHIHFCDYVEANRAAVERWLAGDERDFDWAPYIARCLELEGTGESADDRVASVRAAVDAVTTCDIYASPPVDVSGPVDVIVSNYCLDAVTGDKAEWHAHIRNLATLLKPGGTFLFASLLEARYSDFGETRYPNVYLLPNDVREALELAGFDTESVVVETAAADHEDREYRGVIFGAARKPLS